MKVQYERYIKKKFEYHSYTPVYIRPKILINEYIAGREQKHHKNYNWSVFGKKEYCRLGAWYDTYEEVKRKTIRLRESNV